MIMNGRSVHVNNLLLHVSDKIKNKGRKEWSYLQRTQIETEETNEKNKINSHGTAGHHYGGIRSHDCQKTAQP